MEIRVLGDPDARTFRERIVPIQKVTRWPAIVALVLLAAILAMAGAPLGDPDGARHVVECLGARKGDQQGSQRPTVTRFAA